MPLPPLPRRCYRAVQDSPNAWPYEWGRVNGNRRIAALLRDAGWVVNTKWVERIWRREGLKVPAKQPKRGRLWLGDGSCIRLRPEHPNHVWSYDFVEDRAHDGRRHRMSDVIGNTPFCPRGERSRFARLNGKGRLTLYSRFSGDCFEAWTGINASGRLASHVPGRPTEIPCLRR